MLEGLFFEYFVIVDGQRRSVLLFFFNSFDKDRSWAGADAAHGCFCLRFDRFLLLKHIFPLIFPKGIQTLWNTIVQPSTHFWLPLQKGCWERSVALGLNQLKLKSFSLSRSFHLLLNNAVWLPNQYVPTPFLLYTVHLEWVRQSSRQS